MTKAPDLFKLDGKVALVTGGSRGLGLAAAEGLAEAGADVAICGRNEDSLATALEQLKKNRARLHRHRVRREQRGRRRADGG